MKNKILTKIQDNYGWFVALMTGIGVIGSFIIKFMKYIYTNLYFAYYKIDYGLYNYNDLGIIYDICLSILLGSCIYSMIYCYYQISKLIKIKKFSKEFYYDISIILIVNIILILFSGINLSFLNIFINLLTLIFIEFILSLLIFKSKSNKSEKIMLNDMLKNLPLMIIIIIFFFCLRNILGIINIKEYRIIDDNKAIIYSTQTYYIVLDCEIKNNELILYTGKQTKLKNENIKSDIIRFNKINLR